LDPLTSLPRPPNWIKGSLLLSEGSGGEKSGQEGRKKGKGWRGGKVGKVGIGYFHGY